MRQIVTGLAASLLLLVAAPAQPWSELGHQLVGELAHRLLTPEAKAGVAELLRNEPDPTLAGVAVWADTLRASDPERFRATARWHYINLAPGSCRVVASRDCKDGACLTEAIEAQRRLLSDPTQPFDVRRDALKFIVHFLGDVHQPLHASNRPDKGGNDFQISLRTDTPPEEYARDRYQNGIMGANLHAVWDYYILRSAGLEPGTYAERLAPALRLPRTSQGGPRAWASESCRLIHRRGLYPSTHDMDEQYLNAMRPLAEQRIVQAANRLAQLLNEVFASRKRR